MPGKEGILEAHMLEVCPTIADGEISIKACPLSMGDREDPARLVFTSKTGKGNMVGTAFGAILMATIKNGLSLLNVNTFWHQVVIGIFILFAVALDGYASTRAARNG